MVVASQETHSDQEQEVTVTLRLTQIVIASKLTCWAHGLIPSINFPKQSR